MTPLLEITVEYFAGSGKQNYLSKLCSLKISGKK